MSVRDDIQVRMTHPQTRLMRLGDGVWLAYALVFFAITFSPIVARSEENRPTFAGVRLSKQAAKLLSEVEVRYKKPVRLEANRKLEAGILANAGVDAFGVPFIQLAESLKPDEATIVHELFHLKLYTEGHPARAIWDFSLLPAPSDHAYDWLERMLVRMQDAISHRSFYPRMLEMGLTPNLPAKAFVAKLQKQHDRPDWSPDVRVLTYFTMALELTDQPTIVAQMDAWYAKRGWQADVLKAKEMLAIASKFDLSTRTEKVTEAFVLCANRLLQDRAQIVVRGWLPITNSYGVLVTAAFSLVPAPNCQTRQCILGGTIDSGADNALSGVLW